MPKNTRVSRCVDYISPKYGRGGAIAICQKSTKQNYRTGKKMKGGGGHRREKSAERRVKFGNNQFSRMSQQYGDVERDITDLLKSFDTPKRLLYDDERRENAYQLLLKHNMNYEEARKEGMRNLRNYRAGLDWPGAPKDNSIKKMPAKYQNRTGAAIGATIGTFVTAAFEPAILPACAIVGTCAAAGYLFRRLTGRGRKTRKSKNKKGGKWTRKYKKSINCKKPKGFSQRQHCKYGRKK